MNLETFTALFEHEEIIKLIKEHESDLSDISISGPTAVFWFSFLKMMNIFFAFIRSVKIGNWELHLDAAYQMLPWFFAYDRPNYSRFLTFYWAEMKKLPETHPDVQREFM